MEQYHVTQQEMITSIQNMQDWPKKNDIQILLTKECGNGKLIIQRLIDGLGFIRYDCMRIQHERDPEGEQEPQGILVFLDEGKQIAPVDPAYQEKRKAYQQRIINDNCRNLHLDHRLVAAESELRGTDLLSIAQDFFMTRNESEGKMFDAIVINNVSQVSVIKWLIKNGFDFLSKREKDLFHTIQEHPENRIERDYTTSYGDYVKNTILQKKDYTNNLITENDLIIFQMKKDL